jgi:hypothetical protein
MRHKGTKSHNLTQLQSVELQRLAIRMRRELDLKDRFVPLGQCQRPRGAGECRMHASALRRL